ncbi:MAG TPA: protein tyrosine phosphatase [Xanthobacteraceae bacterium]|nr:protein tyrosine phosphatase [Xanthobacteraceae bacterium]
MIVVCSLSRLQETVEKSRARHVVTLVRDEELIKREREGLKNQGIRPEDHLWLEMDDIADEMDGMIAPNEEHVERLLAFLDRWDRAQPMVVHCYAGISRSTAAAFVAACALSPGRDEAEIAARLRAASPTAYPNRRLVALADSHLGRGGRMSAAIETMGFGVGAYEAEPFVLGLD